MEPVKNLYKSIIDEINSTLDQEERLKRVRFIGDEWTPDSGELSPTLKLKRRVITERYRSVIEEIFGRE